ncbi:MAG: hypothetical protein ABIE94_05205 [archaeon]
MLKKYILTIFLLAILIVMAGCATQDLAGEAKKAVEEAPATLEAPEIDMDKIAEEYYSAKIPNPLIQPEFQETLVEYEKRMDAYERHLAGEDVPEQEYVAVTRWAGPEGTRPMTYQEAQKPSKPFDVEQKTVGDGDRGETVYVLVDESLYSELESYLLRYESDVESEGQYTVEIYSGTYGTPEELRAFLQGLPSIAGAIFVGDFPAIWFEEPLYTPDGFPMDLFYMDLDGEWIDSDSDDLYDLHTTETQDIDLEIWIGRIDASTLNGTSIDLYKNYFDKNHEYRSSNLKLPLRALNYVDNDWAGYWGTRWNGDMEYLYEYTTLVDHLDGTSAPDYKNRLKWNYEWVSVYAHSWPEGHIFNSEYYPWPDNEVLSQEIKSINPHGLFYNLFACSAAQFEEYDYIAGRYLFIDTYGVVVIGSTKTGSMLEFDQFYQPLGQGKNLGEAFKDWFNHIGLNGTTEDEIAWHYGMVVLGDPTLYPNIPNEFPIAHINPFSEDYEFMGYEVVNRTLEISGTAMHGFASNSTFGFYTLSFGEGINPDTWSTDGVILQNNGSAEVNLGLLGDIDTTLMKEGVNTIRLVVKDQSGVTTDHKRVVQANNVYFLEPSSVDIFRSGTIIELIGTASGTDFDHYEIKYGEGLEPSSWHTAEISLENNGFQAVDDGLLGTWDTSSITENNIYTLRLISYNSGIEKIHDVVVFIDPLFMEGWPQRVPGLIWMPTVTVANIDSDDENEVIFATSTDPEVYSGKTYVFDHDGQIQDGWPIYGGAQVPITAYDINNDGEVELLKALSVSISVFKEDGTQLPQQFSVEQNIRSLLCLSDVDDDNTQEIFFAHKGTCGGGTCNFGKTYGLKDFEEFGNWPTLGGSWNNKFAIGDVTGNGEEEIVVATGDSYFPLMIYDVNGNPLQYISPPSPHFQYFTYPTLANLDEDPENEIIVGCNYGETGGDYYTIFAYNFDGSLVDGWPPEELAYSWKPYSPVVADLNNDGEIEIIVVGMTELYTTDSKILVFNQAGELIWNTETDRLFSPVVGDINGDQNQEVVAVRQGWEEPFAQLYAFNYDGSVVEGFPKYFPRFTVDIGLGYDYLNYLGRTPVITDLDNDGDVDIVLGSEHYGMVWDLEGEYNEEYMDWPMYRHDLQNTGTYTPKIHCKNSTLTICGEVFPPDCDYIGDEVCCGDDEPETYVFKQCREDLYPAVDCISDESLNVCCDNSGYMARPSDNRTPVGCTDGNTCFAPTELFDVDSDGHTEDCWWDSWYDPDDNPDHCYIYGGCEEADIWAGPETNCPAETKRFFVMEGESGYEAVFGEYGNGNMYECEGESSDYRCLPYNCDSQLNDCYECCGDDQGEFLISGSGYTRCCNHPNDYIDAEGNCQPTGKTTPISEVPNPR